MSCQFDTSRKCFTFIWILENFEYCVEQTGEQYFSPAFIVDTIARTQWFLAIYPRGEESEEWISLYLHRKSSSKGPARVVLDYELSILATDGSELTSNKISNYLFPRNGSYGYPEFLERNSLFAKPLMFLPQGALTIRCRMWNSLGEVKNEGECIARTRIGVERKSFLWKIQNFRTFDVGREMILKLKSTSSYDPIMSLKLNLQENSQSSEKNLVIKFINSNKSNIFSTFKSSLVDSEKNYIECGQHEFLFSPTIQSEDCILSLSKDKLMENTCRNLPNDVLTLFCEQTISTGDTFDSIECISYECSGSFMAKNVVSEDIKTPVFEESVPEVSYLKADLCSMLKGNILCDVKLCTKSETFPAHWFILSARSPVFRAMFQSDMKEKTKHQINIEDLKPDTVRRMLLYMYTDSLEDLQWETASDLYTAAEKYQIMTLKDKCSAFLKTDLSLTNVCEILLVADLHQDKELKSTVQDFILKNNKSIINSSEWKSLMEVNLPLAAETMLLGYKE